MGLADTLIAIASSLLIAFISAISSVVWKMSSRVTKLEQQYSNHTDWNERFLAMNDEIKKLISDVDERSGSCERAIQEHSLARAKYETSFVRVDIFYAFVDDQDKKWLELNRFIGRMEGAINRANNGVSSIRGATENVTMKKYNVTYETEAGVQRSICVEAFTADDACTQTQFNDGFKKIVSVSPHINEASDGKKLLIG